MAGIFPAAIELANLDGSDGFVIKYEAINNSV